MAHARAEYTENTQFYSIASILTKNRLTRSLARVLFLTSAAGCAGLTELKGCHDNKGTKPSF